MSDRRTRWEVAVVESEVANAGQGVVERSERSKRKESTDVLALSDLD